MIGDGAVLSSSLVKLGIKKCFTSGVFLFFNHNLVVTPFVRVDVSLVYCVVS